MTNLLVTGAVLLVLLGTVSSRVEEAVEVAAAVVLDIRHAQAYNCLPVLVYQQNTAYDFASLALEMVRTISERGSSYLTFTSDEVLFGTTEPSSSVVAATSDACVFYVLLSSLPLVEDLYIFLSRSDWFPGVRRYFTWLGLPASSLELIAGSQTLQEAHGLVIILPQNSGIFSIIVPCPFRLNGEPELVEATHWSSEHGFDRNVQLFPEHYKNCYGYKFSVVSLDYPPFLAYVKKEHGEPVQHLDSIDIRILDTIADEFNFTYAIYEPADGQWGFQLPNKSWTGVIGAVERFEADFSLNVLITGQRTEAVDFTIGYHNEPLTFAMGKPKPLPQWLSLVRPFQVLVWCSVGVTIVVSTIVLWLLILASNNVASHEEFLSGTRVFQNVDLSSDASNRAENFEFSRNNSSYWNAINIIVRGFLRQDIKMPRKSPVQVFLCFWLIAGFVITIGYVSTLTAFLTVPALSPTLNNLEELTLSHFSWGVQNFKAADFQLFKSSDVPLYRTIFRGLHFCSSQKDCLQKTLDENFVFISWLTYLRDSIAVHFTDRHGDSKIVLARDVFAPRQLGFCLKKNSQLKGYMNEVMQRLIEGGFVQKWLSEFIVKHSKEGKAMAFEADLAGVGGDLSRLIGSDGPDKTLTLYHLQGVFSPSSPGSWGCSSSLHRFQLLESPLCRCGHVKTVEHFLLNYDNYSAQRDPLKRLLQCLGLWFNLKNVLGGGDHSSRVQLRIIRVLAQFLSTVGRLDDLYKEKGNWTDPFILLN
ncbi:Ionotropic glutamate receptor [Trinorchestia longiramus]|nr:Ionotropic glutamate receptor [Trinorchestia longiramus]